MKLMEIYRDRSMGAISGLDRIRFRGTLRWLASERGLSTFMNHARILLKDFSGWVEGLTAQVRDSCESRAKDLGIGVGYLTSSGVDKEKLARQIAADKRITEGSICLLSVVEPCIAPMVKGNKASKKLELVMASRKCVFVYHYFNDPVFGFGHVRIQSWAPFNIFICLNGRHWLERQLQKQGIGYVKDGNCFVRIEDIAAAQVLLHEQLKTDWAKLLNGLALGSCPALSQVLRPLEPEYYWSADETEWSTDVMFKSVATLEELFPSFVHHAMRVCDSPSVMKYLGRRSLAGNAPDEVISDYRRRYEGIRASWQKMRKGVSDLHRRCEVSQQCNDRYGDALAAAQVEEKLKEVVCGACNKVVKEGKRYRGLNPWQQEDYRMLMFLAKGENAINGFRNHDLRKWLYRESEPARKDHQKKYSGRTTRRIKLLRTHGLIRKVPRANRYVLTEKGQKFSCSLMTASALDIKALTEMAA